MKKVLIILPAFIPSTIIGVLRPLAELEKKGEVKLRIRLSRIKIIQSQDINWCDVVVFCRNSEIADLEILYDAKKNRKKIIYEIDDNFEEISLDTPVGLYHRQLPRLHAMRRFYLLSDLTRVYSDRLKNLAENHGAITQLNKSYFDSSIIDGLKVKEVKSSVIKIAYPTTRLDNYVLEEKIFSAVRIILAKYPKKVEFHLWRNEIPVQLSGIPGVILQKGERNYEKFIKNFFLSSFSIGLAPGVDTPFFHSKTNNKYREFGGCFVAGIYSNFPPYSNSVKHNVNGILAEDTTDSWVREIERLINDEKLRSNIIRCAKADVSENYSFDSAINKWREVFTLLSKLTDEPVPNWLLRKNYYRFISVVGEESNRHEILNEALSYIDGSVKISKHEDFEGYLSSMEWSDSHNFLSLFLIDDLTTFQQFINCDIVGESILDLSYYKDSIDLVMQLLVNTSVKNLILSKSQETKNHSSYYSKFNVIFVSAELSNADQKFSLKGHLSAYFDLLERGMYCNDSGYPNGKPKISSVSKVSIFYKRQLHRFLVIRKLIACRLGKRDF